MSLMLCLQTCDTNAFLVASAEDLQQLAVVFTHSCLQVHHRINQFVLLAGCNSAMRLQVGFTERGQTDHAGLQGLALSSNRTVVTGNLSWTDCVLMGTVTDSRSSLR